jgi:transcriptional regulator with XRE-family HTH domain
MFFSTLVHCAPMANEHPVLAATLRDARAARGLTQARAASLAGISRRHLALAEAGGNISVTVLKKIMTAYNVSEVALGELARARGTTFRGVSPDVLMAVMGQMTEGIAMITGAVEALRNYVGVSDGDTNAKAADLIRSFTSFAHSADRHQLAALERVMAETLRPDQPPLRGTRKDAQTSRSKRTSRTA